MKHMAAILTLIATIATASAQETRVLFIGNSYTEVNNLPQMVNDMAQSMGESISYASNTPGGCTFMQHCSNRSMEMIRQGGWDMVVLQEQSQYPSFPESQVENEVFPYAARLVDSFYAHNPCGEPIFYMTWGRKNGDQMNAQYFPILGTYEGMDSLLCERYCHMAEANDASLCPVGRVWRYLRQNSEIELYQADESHPSLAGTYAAACAFYVLMFHRDPTEIRHTATLDEVTAETIRNAAKTVVYDSLERWLRPKPMAAFSIGGVENHDVTLISNATNADSIRWDFGDGTDSTTSADAIIHHTYADNGEYTITAIAQRHCMADTATADITVAAEQETIQNANTETHITVQPNPACETARISGLKPGTRIIIYDADGRQISLTTYHNDTATIDMQKYPSGTYLLTIESGEKVFTKKIVKQ